MKTCTAIGRNFLHWRRGLPIMATKLLTFPHQFSQNTRFFRTSTYNIDPKNPPQIEPRPITPHYFIQQTSSCTDIKPPRQSQLFRHTNSCSGALDTSFPKVVSPCRPNPKPPWHIYDLTDLDVVLHGEHVRGLRLRERWREDLQIAEKRFEGSRKHRFLTSKTRLERPQPPSNPANFTCAPSLSSYAPRQTLRTVAHLIFMKLHRFLSLPKILVAKSHYFCHNFWTTTPFGAIQK